MRASARLHAIGQAALIDWRDEFPAWWSFVSLLLSTSLSVAVYWFTSKAFGETFARSFDGIRTNYFTYVLIGELSLSVPSLMIMAPQRFIRQCSALGMFESWMTMPLANHAPAQIMGFGKLPAEAVRILATIAVGWILFEFEISFYWLISFVVLQAISIPLFWGIGYVGASLVVLFGRGDRALITLVSGLSVFSGTYFPTSVLPEQVQAVVEHASPFYLVLTAARADTWSEQWISALILIGLGLPVFFLGRWLFAKSLDRVRIAGSNPIIRY